MQLRTARLCLDCDNVHETQQCPVCASEAFAFMTRWVPAPERRRLPRVATVSSADVAAYRRLLTANALRPKARDLLKKGAFVLAAVSVGRWLWRQSQQRLSAAWESDYGALWPGLVNYCRRSMNREEPAQFAVLREVAREHPRGGNGSGDLPFTYLHVPEREHGFGLNDGRAASVSVVGCRAKEEERGQVRGRERVVPIVRRATYNGVLIGPDAGSSNA